MREIGEGAEGFGAEAALVQLGFYREQRAAFDPAVADAEILRETALVVGGAQELVGLFEAVPFGFCEGDVAALGDVVVGGDDVERSGVGGRVWIGIVLEPRDEICALSDFVGDFSIFALIFADELDGFLGGGEVADGVEGEAGPHGVAAEEPSEAGTLAFAGGAVAGDEAGA